MSDLDALVGKDGAARQAAQTVFDRPVIVEAGAGTGKTTILVARTLSWTLGPGWQRVQRDLEAAGQDSRQPTGPPSDETVAARVLEGVVAITFTEAAAAEMAGRLAERLARVATGETSWAGFDPDLIEGAPSTDVLSSRARALLGQLDRLTACTIHAFCHALLRRHPLEARLHPDFVIDAQGDRVEEIVRTAVEGAVKRAYLEADDERDPGADAGISSPLLELAARGKSPQAVAECVLTLAVEGVPSAGLASDPFEASFVAEISAGLLDDFERLLEIAAGDLSRIKRAANPARVEAALEESVARLRAAKEAGGSGLEAANRICATLSACWKEGAWIHFKNWNKGKFLKGEEATLGERIEPIRELARRLVPRISHLRAAQPDLLDSARRAILPLLQEVEREARSSGVATFQALLFEAWSLLGNYPRILERERRGIRQLLVDEFQDTDRLQCDIVELLALSGVEAAGRPGAVEAPGLFIVGDPKQSIYGWRNADLEAYDRLVDLALSAGGARYPLVRNFRSRAEILTEVERAMAPIMVEEEGLQPPFEPLVASAVSKSREPSPDDPRNSVEYWISWHPDAMAKTRQAEAAEIEARAIAEDIRKLHEAGTAWKECALLMRNASQLDTYLDGFRDAGVPFLVTSDKQYFRRREVIDASALIRCVVAPADHVALLTWLRSPIVGVPDAALIPLWSRGFPRLMTELDGSDLEATGSRLEDLEAVVGAAAAATPEVPGIDRIRGWEQLLIHALRNLAKLRKTFTKEPADRFMEQLRWAFLSEATEGARYLGRYRVSNIERLFRSVESSLEARSGDVQALLRALRRNVALAADAEEALPQDAAEDAVQVMTIHKAKGLEFGHVYVAQLHAKGRQSERNEFDADRRWNGKGRLEYSLFGVATLGFDAVERHRERVSAAEQVRTLYVAMTRAKQRLVLVGNWPAVATKPTSGQPTYVELLGRRREQPDSIAELVKTAGALPEGVVDSAGVRWKFPGLFAPASASAQAQESLGLPDAGEIATAAGALAEFRSSAAAQMERSFLARASLGESHDEPAESAHAKQSKPPPYSRAAALAIGKAVHSSLESWDLETDPEVEGARQTELAVRRLEQMLARTELEAARTEVSEIFARFRRGKLLERLVANSEFVAARELPILMPPTAVSGTNATVGAAVAGVSGTVDLVLSAPDGTYTVIDYKTDRLKSDAEMQDRAELYAPQLATYARAIEQSLGLEQPPNAEIWFLWADRVWPVA